MKDLAWFKVFPKLPSWPLTLPLLRVPSESDILKALLYNIEEHESILFNKAEKIEKVVSSQQSSVS